MDAKDRKYDYQRGNVKGKRVGQAVLDIMSKPQPTITAGEIMENYAPRFLDELESTIEKNRSRYKSPFYVLVLTKKEPWAVNVVRNYFIARQTAPHALQLMSAYQWYTKTLYVVNEQCGEVKLCWSLPAYQECVSISKYPYLWDPDLVKWIYDCFRGKLELDDYSHLFRMSA